MPHFTVRRLLFSLIRGDNGMLRRPKAVMVLSVPYNFSDVPPKFQDEMDFFRFPIIDPAIPTAEIIDLFGYVIPVGADHLPQALDFVTFMGSVEAQSLLAQQPFAQSRIYAPARMDIDPDLPSPQQRKVRELVQTADDAVVPLFYALPRMMWSQMTLGYSLDFSLAGLMAGLFGTRVWMAEIGRSGGSATSQAKAAAARINEKKGGRPRHTTEKQPVQQKINE